MKNSCMAKAYPVPPFVIKYFSVEEGAILEYMGQLLGTVVSIECSADLMHGHDEAIRTMHSPDIMIIDFTFKDGSVGKLTVPMGLVGETLTTVEKADHSDLSPSLGGKHRIEPLERLHL